MNDSEGSSAVRDGVRKYTVLGTDTLAANAVWSEIPEGEEGDYRFFKVKVEMP